MEGLGPWGDIGSRVAKFVQKASGSRFKKFYILRRHLRAPIPSPGNYGLPGMFLIASGGLPRPALVEPKHGLVKRNIQELAEFPALTRRICDQGFITQLRVHSGPNGPACLPCQANMP